MLLPLLAACAPASPSPHGDDTSGAPAACDVTWCRDEDGDGHGDHDTLSNDCSTPTTAVVVCDDCDDTLAAVSPAATETCNGVDDDCDGVIDPPTATDVSTWYQDSDADGYGDPARTTAACEAPAGYTDQGEDCDDREATVNPAQPEVCNDGLDNDCDGTANGCGLFGDHLVQPGQGEEGYYAPSGTGAEMGYALDVYLLDLQGDGLHKPVVSSAQYPDRTSRSNGALSFYGSVPYGASDWDDTSHVYYGSAYQFVGYSITPPLAYDVEGDGAAELLVSAPGEGEGLPASGCVLSLTEIPTSPIQSKPEDALICGPEDGATFGWAMRAADSLYGGSPALVIGAPYSNEYAEASGLLYIVDPAARSTDSPIATISSSTPWAVVGSQIAPVTDLDGDGVGDLAFGTQSVFEDPGGVWIMSGPLYGTLTLDDADTRLTDPSETFLGYNVDVVQDVLGDGLPAIVASSSAGEEGEVYVLSGATTGDATPAEVAGVRFSTTGGPFGKPEHGDINGDGHQDLLLGFGYWSDPNRDLDGGAIFLVSGPLSFKGAVVLDDLADAAWLGNNPVAYVGLSLATGDANNDGFDDLMFSGVPPGNPDSSQASAWFWYGQGI